MHWEKAVGWTISLLFSLTLSFAREEGGPPPNEVKATATALTLAQAQQIALRRNADLRIAQAQVEAAVAQMRIAREFSNPSLSLSVARIKTDGSGNGTGDGNGFLNRSYDSIITLSQLLEIGGKRSLRQESARAGQRAAEAQRDNARRLLLQAVSQAYIAALEAREEAGALAASAASLRREDEIAAVRFVAGDIAAVDQMQIDIAATRLDLDSATARHTATVAVVLLETLLGEPSPRGETPLADTLGTLIAPPAALVDQTPAGPRPDVAAAEASLAKAEADFAEQRRERIPSLTLSIQYERNPPDTPNTAGIGLSFPLPLWNLNRGSIHAARAAREQAQAQLDKTRVQASADVAAARSAFREARVRAATYAGVLAVKSAAVVKTATYAYEHGGTALVELLAAERNDNDIRVAAVRAQADAASAVFALAAALNRLAPEPEGAPAR